MVIIIKKTLFLLVFVSILSIGIVSAQECGGMITENTVLDEDIVDCECHGLIIFARGDDDVTLNCDGHTISGSRENEGCAGVSIRSDRQSKVIVKNCNINNFDQGAYISGNNNILMENIFTENNYGVWINYFSHNTTTHNNIIIDNIISGFETHCSDNGTFWNNSLIGNELNVYEDRSCNGAGEYQNDWNTTDLGNYWDDFEDNDGYPNYYVIEGNGDGIDWHPYGVEELEGEFFEIELHRGWNMISSPYIPENLDIEEIFSDISDRIDIVKDEDGYFYVPGWEYNGIGNWDPYKGYLIKMNEDATLLIRKDGIISTSIELEQRGNLFAYPLLEARDMRGEGGLIEEVFQEIAEGDDRFILKNDMGEFYMPSERFNNIDQMIPGEGYQIYTSRGGILEFAPEERFGAVPSTTIPIMDYTPSTKSVYDTLSRDGRIISNLFASWIDKISNLLRFIRS